MSDNGVFNETQPESLETLVGEGKKYATVEDLAKAYAHADQTIEARNRELAELRQELDVRSTVEDQLKRLNTNTSDNQRQTTPPVDPPNPQQFTEEDLVARIRAVTEEQDQQRRVALNINQVASKLVEVYGSETKANEVVALRAQELGVSVKFLQDVAAQSPTAFFAQIGLDQTSQRSNTAQSFKSDIIPQAVGQGGVKVGSYEFYDNMRKTDPKQYFTPKIQNQLMKDATEGRYVPG